MSLPATSRSLPRLRWNWDFGPLLGDVDTSRLLQLLSALAEGGALGSAARASGMSYRSAWGLLRDCEQALGASMVVMERGRGTRLTEFGMALVELDSAARRALEEVHAPWQRKLEARQHGALVHARLAAEQFERACEDAAIAFVAPDGAKR